MPKLTPKKPFRPVSFWLPPDVRAEVEAVATQDGRTVSQWVRVAVTRELSRLRESATAGAAAREVAHVDPA